MTVSVLPFKISTEIGQLKVVGVVKGGEGGFQLWAGDEFVFPVELVEVCPLGRGVRKVVKAKVRIALNENGKLEAKIIEKKGDVCEGCPLKDEACKGVVG